MVAKVNMYVYLEFGENWTTNTGDRTKSLFVQLLFLLSSFSFFSLNPSISTTVRGKGLHFSSGSAHAHYSIYTTWLTTAAIFLPCVVKATVSLSFSKSCLQARYVHNVMLLYG